MSGVEQSSPWNTALIEQNRLWLMPYLHSLVGNREDARDLVQEVFLIAIENQDKFDGVRPLGAWLRGIARNVVHRHWRKRGRLPILADDSVMQQLDDCATAWEASHTDTGESPVRLEALKECLGHLTHRVREAFRLKYGETLDSETIGRRLAMRENSVNKALSRGRTLLASCIEQRLLRLGYE